MKQQGEQKINPQNKDEYRKDKMNGSQEKEIKIKIKKTKMFSCFTGLFSPSASLSRSLWSCGKDAKSSLIIAEGRNESCSRPEMRAVLSIEAGHSEYDWCPFLWSFLFFFLNDKRVHIRFDMINNAIKDARCSLLHPTILYCVNNGLKQNAYFYIFLVGSILKSWFI